MEYTYRDVYEPRSILPSLYCVESQVRRRTKQGGGESAEVGLGALTTLNYGGFFLLIRRSFFPWLIAEPTYRSFFFEPPFG